RAVTQGFGKDSRLPTNERLWPHGWIRAEPQFPSTVACHLGGEGRDDLSKTKTRRRKVRTKKVPGAPSSRHPPAIAKTPLRTKQKQGRPEPLARSSFETRSTCYTRRTTQMSDSRWQRT